MIKFIVAAWLLISASTSIALVAGFWMAVNPRKPRKTDCKRCKWLIRYVKATSSPALCKKVSVGYYHSCPIICGYFEDYQEGEKNEQLDQREG